MKAGRVVANSVWPLNERVVCVNREKKEEKYVFLTEDERAQMEFVFVCDLQIANVCVCVCESTIEAHKWGSAKDACEQERVCSVRVCRVCIRMN